MFDEATARHEAAFRILTDFDRRTALLRWRATVRGRPLAEIVALVVQRERERQDFVEELRRHDR